MGPILWWWRMWSRVIDPGREQELAASRTRADEEQQRADRLTSELADRDSEISALEKHLAEVEGELQRVRRQLTELEGGEAELRARVDELLGVQAEADRLRQRLDEAAADHAEAERVRAGVQDRAAAGADTPPDVSAAQAVLGRRIEPDDLTVVEGVGPKIAGLLNDAGITSWRALSETDAADLRGILDRAGPRYRMHDPESWPGQAALLAQGEWRQFADARANLQKR